MLFARCHRSIRRTHLSEVASMLGVPVSTAKARIRDALIRLRDCMQAA
jgi:DNA-directed RNA polymerase specialized sigma24 family protein